MSKQEIRGLRSSKDNWFTCVDTEVLKDEVLSPEAKLVFCVLCMMAGFGYRSCASDDDEVADLAGLSIRTLYRVYDELEGRGVISRTRTDWHIQLIGHNAPCYSEEEAL